MKTIKNISLALLVVFGALSFQSCEDEDKNPIPELERGGFVKFVEQPFQWNGTSVAFTGPPAVTFTRYDIGNDLENAVFTAMTEDPTGNVASYEIFVTGDFTDAPEEPIAFKSTTTFPFDVSFTTADMANLFNVDISTFDEDDRFIFTSIVTTTDGRVFNSLAANCDCPAPEGDSAIVEDPGTYNGGTIDQVLLNSGDTGVNFLLPANGYIVSLSEFAEE